MYPLNALTVSGRADGRCMQTGRVEPFQGFGAKVAKSNPKPQMSSQVLAGV